MATKTDDNAIPKFYESKYFIATLQQQHAVYLKQLTLII